MFPVLADFGDGRNLPMSRLHVFREDYLKSVISLYLLENGIKK
jgi:hypothetical protein